MHIMSQVTLFVRALLRLSTVSQISIRPNNQYRIDTVVVKPTWPNTKRLAKNRNRPRETIGFPKHIYYQLSSQRQSRHIDR